jgi:hypothetical protein
MRINRLGAMNRLGTRFCSQDCCIAYSGYENIRVLPALMIIIGFGAGLLIFQINLLSGILLPSIMTLGGTLLYREEIKNVDSIRTRMPKDSRRYDPILVEKMSSIAKCVSCGGNLDLADLDDSGLIKCEYYGAMGVLKFE